MTQTKFLDLDAIAPEMELAVKLGGKTHVFRPTSVEAYFANTKMVADFLKENPDGDQTEEFKLGVTMILKSFPTMTREMLMNLTFVQLQALQNWIRQADGSDKVEEEAKADAGANPPAAVSNSTSDSSSAA